MRASTLSRRRRSHPFNKTTESIKEHAIAPVHRHDGPAWALGLKHMKIKEVLKRSSEVQSRAPKCRLNPVKAAEVFNYPTVCTTASPAIELPASRSPRPGRKKTTTRSLPRTYQGWGKGRPDRKICRKHDGTPKYKPASRKFHRAVTHDDTAAEVGSPTGGQGGRRGLHAPRPPPRVPDPLKSPVLG